MTSVQRPAVAMAPAALLDVVTTPVAVPDTLDVPVPVTVAPPEPEAVELAFVFVKRTPPKPAAEEGVTIVALVANLAPAA
jgi:hypothetical protein